MMTSRWGEVTVDPQLVLFITEFLYFGDGWQSKAEQFDVAAQVSLLFLTKSSFYLL